MSDVMIIGGGAAGMMAACLAAEGGHSVILFEKNEKLGKKLFITGKGRCNLTNACDMEGLLNSVVKNPKFMYSAFYGFTNEDVMAFFERLGCPLKTERGGRVFPASDHSSDIISALRGQLERLGVTVRLQTRAEGLLLSDGRVRGVRLKGEELYADSVIVATGGLAYPSTGAAGDGYDFARAAGHQVEMCHPALVPLETAEAWVRDIMGLALKNVAVEVRSGKKKLFSGFGEMLFTHYGVSGPLILTASSYLTKELSAGPLSMTIDLKPALTPEQLDARLLREFEEKKHKQFKNSLGGLFPVRLIPVMIEASGIDAEKKVHEVTKEERRRFAGVIKALPLTLTGFRDFNEAIITRGGVAVKEINPSTMQSKHVAGLYFIGEVLDVDAITGGFNLQIAWSTAAAAAGSLT